MKVLENERMLEKTSSRTKGERTRAYLLECAAKVIAREGIDRANLARIAKEADTVPSHLAHYFPRKAELPLEVIRHIFSKLYSDVGVRKAESASPEERLVRAVEENYLYFKRNPDDYSVIVLAYYYARIHKEIKKFMGKVYETNVTNTLEVLRQIQASKARKRSNEELRRFAEGVTFDLEGGLIYYFFSAHGLPFETFVQNHLEGLRLRIHAYFDT